MPSNCSTAFGAELNGENLVSFFATEGHNDFYHCGLVIDNCDFSDGESQRGEYLRKRKRF